MGGRELRGRLLSVPPTGRKVTHHLPLTARRHCMKNTAGEPALRRCHLSAAVRRDPSSRRRGSCRFSPASHAVPAIACPCQTAVRITIGQGITSFVKVEHRAGKHVRPATHSRGPVAKHHTLCAVSQAAVGVEAEASMANPGSELRMFRWFRGTANYLDLAEHAGSAEDAEVDAATNLSVSSACSARNSQFVVAVRFKISKFSHYPWQRFQHVAGPQR